jgi:hypothetical protein
MIEKSEQFDFLRDMVENIPDPQEKAPAARRKPAGEGAASAGTSRSRKNNAAALAAAKVEEAKKETVPPPGSLPAIGTWKRDAVGGGGSGEGGRGMFDDYEDDNYDDY